MLATKTKIALARTASTLVSASRGLIGRGSPAIVRRGGHYWELDLGEGIDFSIFLLGGFERRTAAVLRRLIGPGAVALDIGANIGAHTLGMASGVGPTGCVVAVEPSAEAFAKLTRNITLNPDLGPRIRARQLLLSNASSASPPEALYASWPLHPSGPVHGQHGGRLVATTGAAVDTLDGLMAREGFARLDLMKIDVDGFEGRVMAGGQGTLARFRPVIVIELAPYVHAEAGSSFLDLVELLKRADYGLVEASNGRAVPLDAELLGARIPPGSSLNVVAQPEAAGAGVRPWRETGPRANRSID